MALIDAAFLQGIMSAEDYRRVFDKNATGTVDSTFLGVCIDAAQSQAYLILNGGGAILLPLDIDGSVVDRGILVAIARMAIYEATRYHPSDGQGGEKSPWRLGYEDAVNLLNDIKRDRQRTVTAQNGRRAKPWAEDIFRPNPDGNIGPPYARILTWRDTSGY